MRRKWNQNKGICCWKLGNNNDIHTNTTYQLNSPSEFSELSLQGEPEKVDCELIEYLTKGGRERAIELINIEGSQREILEASWKSPYLNVAYCIDLKIGTWPHHFRKRNIITRAENTILPSEQH